MKEAGLCVRRGLLWLGASVSPGTWPAVLGLLAMLVAPSLIVSYCPAQRSFLFCAVVMTYGAQHNGQLC